MMRESLLRNGKDVTLLLTWFKKDTNVIPSVYTLQPISSIIENFNNKVFRIRGILVDCSDRWLQLSLSRNSSLLVLDVMLILGFWEFFLCDYLTWNCVFLLRILVLPSYMWFLLSRNSCSATFICNRGSRCLHFFILRWLYLIVIPVFEEILF